MSAPPAAPPSPESLPYRAVALATLALLAALLAAQPAWSLRLRAAWFDALQQLAPREVHALPATIVAIDDRSLAALGQWPWPRTVLARLVEAIERRRPAAIGLDVLMPEPDRLSPEQLLPRVRALDPALAERLAALESNDAALARAVAAAPVVLAVAGTQDASAHAALRAAPVLVSGPGSGPPALPRYAGAITSIDAIDRAAAGHGAISVEPSNGVFRRFPLVVDIGGTLAPAFATELLRVAFGQPALRLRRTGSAVTGVSIGDLDVPTEPDGALTLYYSPSDARRYVSAVDVLEGRVDADALARKLVLIGATGVGLRDDYRSTPLGQPMPGSELHAQLLENLLEGSFLRRPAAAHAAELALFVMLGLLLARVTRRWSARAAALLAAGCVLAFAGAALLAFRTARLLIDATPALALLPLFTVLLVMTLTEAARRRRALERQLQAQRERAAFVQGELDAARRIQAGMLPAARSLHAERRIDLDAAMTPAREVGGDLYDFFLVERDRLFFMIGDVAGKGLSASLFMAVSKALCKSVALRAGGAGVGELMRQADAEVSRDNAAMLFVTAFIGVLDLESGELEYCNAGHDDPYALAPDGAAPARLAGGDGPPLCAVDGYAYRGATHRLKPGELLCLVTDGVAEARDAAGALYGSERLRSALARLDARTTTAQAAVEALRADVAAFVGDAEPADDLTVLALRWLGPGRR